MHDLSFFEELSADKIILEFDYIKSMFTLSHLFF